MTTRMQWDDDWVDYWQQFAAFRNFRRLDIYRATRILAAWTH